MQFEITLLVARAGAPCGTTCDVIDALDAAAAEAAAIDAWQALRPDVAFVPLLTVVAS